MPISTIDISQDKKCRQCREVELSYEQYCRNKLCYECNDKLLQEEARKDLASYKKRLHYYPKKHLEIIEAITESPKPMFLYGSCGSGKTVKACAIGKAYSLQNKKVFFYSCPKLIVKLQSLFSKNEITLDEYLEIICKNEVIILDDLGAEKLTGFVKQCLYMIINDREMNGLDTIITSNFKLSEIAHQIDIRIASRIRGMCQVEEMSGADRRQSK